MPVQKPITIPATEPPVPSATDEFDKVREWLAYHIAKHIKEGTPLPVAEWKGKFNCSGTTISKISKEVAQVLGKDVVRRDHARNALPENILTALRQIYDQHAANNHPTISYFEVCKELAHLTQKPGSDVIVASFRTISNYFSSYGGAVHLVKPNPPALLFESWEDSGLLHAYTRTVCL